MRHHTGETNFAQVVGGVGTAPTGVGATGRWQALGVRCARAFVDYGALAVSLLFSLVVIARTAFTINGTTYFTLFDDAMISLRYAQNFAAEHGLVWNAGEAPVEGYTNFLWTLWLAALHLLPIGTAQLPLLVMVSGALILLGNILAVGGIATLLAPQSRFVRLFALWFTACCYPLIYWTLRGMEVGLITLLISAALLLTLRLRATFDRRTLAGLALLLSLGVLTRTDALLPAGIMGAFAVLVAQRRERFVIACTLGGAVCGTFALHTLFRLYYYGYPFPNTYYLKVSGIGLDIRLATGLDGLLRIGIIHLALPLIFATWYLVTRRRAVDRGVWLLVAIFLGQCAYSAYVGGDAWEWLPYANRYITPGLPALGIVVALAIDNLLRAERPYTVWRSWVRLGVPALLVLLAVNGPSVADWVGQNAYRTDSQINLTAYGLALRETTAPTATVAVLAAGAIPYYAERGSIDLLGKCDHVIATSPPHPVATFRPGHNKWDYAYSIGQLRPDVIHLPAAWTTAADVATITGWGYQPLTADLYVRRDSQLVDRAALLAAVQRIP